MAVKKSELYSSLWQSCDALRGGMDASQYKDYVLVLLFLKYISDKYAGKRFAPLTIPEGATFADMVKLKGKSTIGDDINKKIVAPLVSANQQLSLADFSDFNDEVKLGSGKEKVDRLTDLIAIFENPALDFSKNRADGDDLLGDAYEYLMRHFATESGKSKGQFLTPAEVSRVISLILGMESAKITNATTAYDPTCGSGSLLLKLADTAARAHPGVKISLYGQEKDSSTAGLARMNMILHDCATAEIKQGNTLANPLFLDGDSLKTFDFAAANPPFSDKRWSTGLDPENEPHGRFGAYGIPPDKQGDYAYLLHIIRSLKAHGKGACILPHGVLFRGNAEAAIRKNLLQRGFIKGIIGLPANLFYGTGIPACIIVIDKEMAAGRKAVFLIDASKGFRKDGPKNRLRERDIHRIVHTFTTGTQIPGYSRLVPLSEIADPKNDYNLNLPRYIDSSEPEDIQDLTAHLHGGIPTRDIDSLHRFWDLLPGLRTALFQNAERPGYAALRVPAAALKETILEHSDFSDFRASVLRLFAKWRKAETPGLQSIDDNTLPKELIRELSERLLATFKKSSLLDPYDLYQHLMDYWSETMQDDCYLIAADGWKAAAQPCLIVAEKGKKSTAQVDLVLGKKKYTTELIPPALVIQRYYSEEQAAIDALEAELAELNQQIDEMVEEHSGEDGLLAGAVSDIGNLTNTTVKTRLKELKDEKAPNPEERTTLKAYLDLTARVIVQKRKQKDAETDLTEKVLKKYQSLTIEEIHTLVVDDKWMATLDAAVRSELDRLSQALTTRICELADRYATPLPELESEVEALAAKVAAHLQSMGVEA